MSDSPPVRAVPRLAWFVDAAIAAGAASTGALLIFGRARDGAFASFSAVGQAVGRDWSLSPSSHIALGLFVHLGQMAALGALMALFLGSTRIGSRLRAALLVVLAWELAARLPWLALIRADVAANLAFAPRLGLAVLVITALALAPRRR